MSKPIHEKHFEFEDCVSCPFFDEYQSENMPYGGCAINQYTVIPFTKEEDDKDEPPDWCPLRKFSVVVSLKENG